MKKIIFISITISVLLSGCKESFIDLDRPLVSTESVIFTNPAKTEMTVLGLYATLKAADYMGGRTYIAFDAMGDDIMNIDPNGVTLYNTYIMQVFTTTQENAPAWNTPYLAINRANVFLESLEEYNTAEIIGDALAKQYIAEAKFVRAFAYYYLVQLYAPPYKLNKGAKAIPLRLTAIKGSGHSDQPCTTNTKILETILNDLSDSEIAALPATTSVKNRATKGAALMLKMRTLMLMENWQGAIAAGEAVSGYELIDDVFAPFVAPYTTNESIFTFLHTANDQPGTQRSPWEYYNNGRLLVIDRANGVMSKPNYSLAADKRIKAFDGGPISDPLYTDHCNLLLKFPLRPCGTPIFRFAETKLNLAECYAQSNREGDARSALTQVRRRSIAADDDPLDISALTGAALLEAISNEKRLEFIGEGMRGLDIMRKGETFYKTGSLTGAITVTPQSQFYFWPIPEDERVNNALWDQLEP